jgi:hypothetical protein
MEAAHQNVAILELRFLAHLFNAIGDIEYFVTLFCRDGYILGVGEQLIHVIFFGP